MEQQAPRAIFCYSFRDLAPADPDFGGFVVNLYSDNKLVYSTYNSQMRLTGTSAFNVGPEVCMQYLELVRYAYPWLRHVPARITMSNHPITESSFGFDGYPIFRLEDIDQLRDLPFASLRGHYARFIYLLLEKISALLATYGIRL